MLIRRIIPDGNLSFAVCIRIQESMVMVKLLLPMDVLPGQLLV